MTPTGICEKCARRFTGWALRYKKHRACGCGGNIKLEKEEIIHIKNLESYPDKTFCGKLPKSNYGNSGPLYVKWRYPTIHNGFEEINCKKCIKKYNEKFSLEKDLSFSKFTDEDFRGRDFRGTSIVGCDFVNCKLDGMKFNSISCTHGTIPYARIRLPDGGYMLKWNGIYPEDRIGPYSRPYPNVNYE